ncbi:HAMP domain-containing histidine kinase [Halosimplex pelagicum]|uniref:histidine kinase n=2 Tax=Halosimplex pelagicum TaxID=869886 RepID=A0A7D5P9B9_9EURY|nr:HAMP domain-containing histidine kinase [Halosimplex pelagicum]
MRPVCDPGEFWPVAIACAGGCLGLILLGESIVVFVGPHNLFGPFSIGVFSSFVAVASLIYGGYWILTSNLSSERYRRIGVWCAASGVVFLTFNFFLMVTLPPFLFYLAFGWMRWALSVGASVGLLIGLFEARAIERARVAERLQIKQQATERQNEFLEEFASIVSHDLRNPLNVAQGRLQIAQDEVESEHLDTVETSLERIEKIITNTLILAREGQTVGEATLIDLDVLVDECWGAVNTKNAELVTETLPTIEADPDRLRHIFENLFRNAVEHGGDDVVVRVGTLSDRDGIFVEDNGPGIPPDKADVVFETGYTTTTQGSGFGLGIVARIVQAHGWEIRVTTGDEGGARFEITGVTVANQSISQVGTG